MNPLERTQAVLARCLELGFAAAGVAPALPSSFEASLRQWLGAGRHGPMEYLARNTELRVDPAAMVPGARAILCVADRYSTGARDRRVPGRGRIARYARGDDYHVVMKRRLEQLATELAKEHAGETFRVCVDTAPVLEREHAARAGLGRIGKHTLLIGEGGSWLLLGEIITTLELVISSPPTHPDPCGTCTRCIDACPTSAISPWSVDASRCISTLTIEQRLPVDPVFHEAMGDWIFGCDICQEVCPHNQPTRRRKALPVLPAYSPRRDAFDLLDVLDWSEEERALAFIRSAMKRAKLDMMKRNALIAAGNVLAPERSPALEDRLRDIARDEQESPMVRETAEVVCRRLGLV